MKKTFKLSHPKLAVARHVDAIKHEVKKYIRRERNKALPEDVDYWDFDCRIGADEACSEAVQISEINKFITEAESNEAESFYLEIIAKPGYRNSTPAE
ncbi:DUF6172 family protein [Amphritea sp.]|uniref:DUF6172 family protein n=1 Tax=Amphritea sp. TaxID=1872502 RepID=UPI0025B8812F|nr:DUF6172 family protein [Amphritea sp.]